MFIWEEEGIYCLCPPSAANTPPPSAPSSAAADTAATPVCSCPALCPSPSGTTGTTRPFRPATSNYSASTPLFLLVRLHHPLQHPDPYLQPRLLPEVLVPLLHDIRDLLLQLLHSLCLVVFRIDRAVDLRLHLRLDLRVRLRQQRLLPDGVLQPAVHDQFVLVEPRLRLCPQQRILFLQLLYPLLHRLRHQRHFLPCHSALTQCFLYMSIIASFFCNCINFSFEKYNSSRNV